MDVEFLKQIVDKYDWFEVELQNLTDRINKGGLDTCELHNLIGQREQVRNVLNLFNKIDDEAYYELKLRGEMEE